MSRNDFIPLMTDLAKKHNKDSKILWLSDYRCKQIDLLNNVKFPNQKVEHFKYNRLDIIDDKDFYKVIKEEQKYDLLNLDDYVINNLKDNYNTDRIVFVNGIFSGSLSKINFHKVTEFAKSNTSQQKKIIKMLNQGDMQYNPFALLNASLSENGVLIEIDKDSPDAIIETIMIYNSDYVNATTANQILFDISDGAKAVSLTKSISINLEKEQTGLTTTRSIYNVGTGAEFTHYQLQLEGAESLNFSTVEYNLYDKTKLDAFYATTGGNLKKIDIKANHLGQHAYAGIDGLYIATDNQQVDYHTTINHPLPNGRTNENFRGIINGSAEAVFNGRIHIYEDAQKTLAELSNKNLLMSDSAVIHTKPELEIYADDVICAHGATVSRMDDESKYYMQARGIGSEEAEIMLSLGFINELLCELPHKEVADYIRPILFSRFDRSL